MICVLMYTEQILVVDSCDKWAIAHAGDKTRERPNAS